MLCKKVKNFAKKSQSLLSMLSCTPFAVFVGTSLARLIFILVELALFILAIQSSQRSASFKAAVL
jgi:hypothetical protein